MFLLLRPCGLAFEATRSKTRRALDDIRKDTYPVLVIRQILQEAPDSLVSDSPVGWCWIKRCDKHPHALPSALPSVFFSHT